MAVAKSTPVVKFRVLTDSLEAEVDSRVALGACGVTVGIDWLVGVEGLAATDPAVVGAGAVDRADAAAEDRLELRDELSDGRLIKKSVHFERLKDATSSPKLTSLIPAKNQGRALVRLPQTTASTAAATYCSTCTAGRHLPRCAEC